MVKRKGGAIDRDEGQPPSDGIDPVEAEEKIKEIHNIRELIQVGMAK